MKALCSALGAFVLLIGGVAYESGTGIIGVRTAGNKVVCVHPGSPCSMLEKGDRIVAINGYSSKTDTKGEPGEEITLTIRRGGVKFDVTVRRVRVQDLNDRALNQYFGVR